MFFKSAKYRKAFLKSLLFVLPGVIITLVFVIYPVINTAWLSLNSWNGIGGSPIKWVGLQNYIKTLTSVKFWNSMLNALYFVIGGFVILMPIAFGLALLVTSKLKGTKFFKAAYLMPVMLGTTAVGLMWSFMLNANFGVLAQFLKAIGHSEWIINWLATPTVNIWCVVLVNEWMYAGYNMLIFAAGIVAIPDDVHEAALLDGLNPWPSAFTFINGKTMKVWKSSVQEKQAEEAPGTVISADKEGIRVACGKNVLVLQEVQLEGKKRMEADAFLRGYQLKPGDMFKDSRE